MIDNCRETLLIMTLNAEVQFSVENIDAYTYDQLLSILMPNVIAQLPCKLNFSQTIPEFILNSEISLDIFSFVQFNSLKNITN